MDKPDCVREYVKGRTAEEKRLRNAARSKAYYEAHREEMKKKNRERAKERYWAHKKYLAELKAKDENVRTV